VATGIIYLFLSLAFLTSGLLLIHSLNRYFHRFYVGIKAPIWFATFFLFFSLFVRATLNMLRYFDETGLEDAIDQSLRDNTLFAPLYDTFLYVFSDLFPQGAQLLSLVFGLIRKRKNKSLASAAQPDGGSNSQTNSLIDLSGWGNGQ
jgi:hypothetical protein